MFLEIFSFNSSHRVYSDNDNVTITQDPVKAVSKSSSRKKDSEASFYSLYTAGSSLSIDLDIWEHEVGVDSNERKNSKSSSDNSSKDLSEKNSKGSHNSYSEFCKDTSTWLEEDVFCAPKATVDCFEDDEIVSSFSKFNQLMEKIKDTKIQSDLSDFDEKHDEPAVIKPEPAIIEKKPTKTSCSTDSSSTSSSTHEASGCIQGLSRITKPPQAQNWHFR